MPNHDERLERLFAAARQPVDTAGREEHFETRLLARLAERRAQGRPWQLLVWRMIPAFAAMAILSLAISLAFNPSRSGDVFAAMLVAQDEGIYSRVLTGE